MVVIIAALTMSTLVPLGLVVVASSVLAAASVVTAPMLWALVAYDYSALQIVVATPRWRHVGAVLRLLVFLAATIPARLLLL